MPEFHGDARDLADAMWADQGHVGGGPKPWERSFARAPLCPFTGDPCPHPAACGLAAGLATYCPR